MSAIPDFYLPGAVTLNTATVDVNSLGDNTLIAAVAGKKIVVFGCVLIADGTVNIRFEDGAAGTALTGQMPVTQFSGFTLPFSQGGWFETSVNTLLNLELSGATKVAGTIRYAEI